MRRVLARFLAVLPGLCAIAPSGEAMTFRVSAETVGALSGGSNLILARGAVEAGDADRFACLLSGVPNDHTDTPEWVIAPDSDGGDPPEAIRLTRAFHEAGTSTRLRPGARRILAVLGGTLRDTTSGGVMRELGPGARLGTEGSAMEPVTAEQARRTHAAILGHRRRMGGRDAGALPGLSNRSGAEAERIETPRELRVPGGTLSGKPTRPPEGWAIQSSRLTVAELLQPMGLDGRIAGPSERMTTRESFRQAPLDARHRAGGLHAHLWAPVRIPPASDAIEPGAGRAVMADPSPIGIRRVPLQRGASSHHDTCFGPIPIVASSDGVAGAPYNDTRVGFPPDTPLWQAWHVRALHGQHPQRHGPHPPRRLDPSTRRPA